MVKNFQIYINSQFKYLFLLMLLFVLPLGLFYEFTSYPLPNIQYIVLCTLFFFQYFIYKDRDFRRAMGPFAQEQLRKELGRIPARAEINERLILISRFRGVSVIITALSIIAVMTVYKKF